MPRPSIRNKVWRAIAADGSPPYLTPTDLSEKLGCSVSSGSKYLAAYHDEFHGRLCFAADGRVHVARPIQKEHDATTGQSLCGRAWAAGLEPKGAWLTCSDCLEEYLAKGLTGGGYAAKLHNSAGPAGNAAESAPEPRSESGQAEPQGGKPKHSQRDLEAAAGKLVEVLDSLGGSAPVDEDTVADIARREIAAAGVGKIEITVEGNGEVIEIKDAAHRVVPEVVRAVKAGLRNVWLAGPTGTGKTYLAKQVAAALFPDRNDAFAFVSGAPDLSSSVFLGWFNPVSESYKRSDFVRIVETGGVFLLDEYDALDDGLRVSLNTVTANGHLSVPFRLDAPVAKRHKDFVFIICTNTWGSGADAEYTGRDTIDAASQDRFLAKFWTGYDESLEKKLVGEFKGSRRVIDGDWSCPQVKSDLSLQDALQQIRLNVEKKRVRRALSTRTKLDAAKLEAAGYSTSEVLTLALTSWTQTERDKALEGVIA